jgi:hypothetical protein
MTCNPMQLIMLLHSFIKFPRTPNAHNMHILVQVLHLDRGMVTSWPQVLIAVVVFLEDVKVAGIHKVKDEFRNYKNSTYMTIPLSHHQIQMLSCNTL